MARPITGPTMSRLKSEFVGRLRVELPDEAERLAEALESTEPSVSVRVNPVKEGGRCFDGENDKVAWCGDGRYLDCRPDFTLDPAMHQGRYYVQDASSMILWHILKEISGEIATPGRRPLRYLDACAAPGGKTTAACAALPADALVVANEYDFRRAEILKENIIKWGKADVAVSRGDTARFRRLLQWFDIVAADVPCSGEGMMRKDLKACEQWSEALVEECAVRQHEIVRNLWEALRPGGYFIYSTCTFNRRENEEVVAMIVDELGGEHVDVTVDPAWGVVDTGLMLRFLPSRLRGEGLAVGVIRKPEESAMATDCGDECVRPARSVKAKGKKNGVRNGDGRERVTDMRRQIEECRGWLVGGDGFELRQSADEIRAVRMQHKDEISELENALDLIHYGIAVGTVKGRDVVPAHGLRMSERLRRGAFHEVEVDLATALTYLRREAPQGIEAPRGHVLLTYGGFPLGFVNHLGNRSNNLYPSAWRILKQS